MGLDHVYQSHWRFNKEVPWKSLFSIGFGVDFEENMEFFIDGVSYYH
jgi:hypothetical protein